MESFGPSRAQVFLYLLSQWNITLKTEPIAYAFVSLTFRAVWTNGSGWISFKALTKADRKLPARQLYLPHKFVSLTKHFSVLGAEIWADWSKGLKQYGSDKGASDYIAVSVGLQNDHYINVVFQRNCAVSLLPRHLPPILCLQKQSGTFMSVGMFRLKHNGGVSGNLAMSQADKRTP